jgi:hypothetical protein
MKQKLTKIKTSKGENPLSSHSAAVKLILNDGVTYRSMIIT